MAKFYLCSLVLMLSSIFRPIWPFLVQWFFFLRIWEQWKYIIGEIFSSGGATLYKNPSDQTVCSPRRGVFQKLTTSEVTYLFKTNKKIVLTYFSPKRLKRVRGHMHWYCKIKYFGWDRYLISCTKLLRLCFCFCWCFQPKKNHRSRLFFAYST